MVARLFAPHVIIVLLVPAAAAAYTPRALPIPPSCVARCRGKDLACRRQCTTRWAQLPWRQKLASLRPKAGPRCLRAERTCCGKALPCTRCRPALRRCVWRTLGIRARPMRRCWARFTGRQKRCRGLPGRAGWSCRRDATVGLHDCRRKAMPRRPRHDDDAYRLEAMVEEEMGREAAR